MTTRLPKRWRPVIAICLIPALVVAPPLMAAANRDARGEAACLNQLNDTETPRIGCTVAFNIDKAQRSRLAELTAGVLTDANCRLKVDVARKTLFKALLNRTRLQVPPQATACRIQTNSDPIRTTFTLAPDIGFKQARAVSATPGLDNIQGLPPLLAGLLKQWVNNSDAIEQAMIHEINGFIDSDWQQ